LTSLAGISKMLCPRLRVIFFLAFATIQVPKTPASEGIAIFARSTRTVNVRFFTGNDPQEPGVHGRGQMLSIYSPMIRRFHASHRIGLNVCQLIRPLPELLQGLEVRSTIGSGRDRFQIPSNIGGCAITDCTRPNGSAEFI